MKRPEFVEAVRHYGVDVPDITNDYYERLLQPSHPGMGRGRDYSEDQVRTLVAHRIVTGLTGVHNHRLGETETAKLREQARSLMVSSREGWVVMSSKQVWWTESFPASVLRNECAVAIPVPAWRDLHPAEVSA